jgi:autotransporter-associated beta strand protein
MCDESVNAVKFVVGEQRSAPNRPLPSVKKSQESGARSCRSSATQLSELSDLHLAADVLSGALRASGKKLSRCWRLGSAVRRRLDTKRDNRLGNETKKQGEQYMSKQTKRNAGGKAGAKILATSIAALLLGAAGAKAQSISIDAVTGTATQNFDTLLNTGAADAWTNGTTLSGWYLFNKDSAAISAYAAGTGSATGGSFYSFGAASSTERALGGLASGGAYFGSPASGAVAGYMAVALTNNSGGDLDSFTLGFDGEEWRNGGNTTPQSMVLQYGFGSTFTGVTTWATPGGNFDWTSPVATASAGAVDGNVAGLVGGRGGLVNGLTWNTGTTLWVRWIENNDAGNDHGLAIDNFSITWNGAIAVLLYWDLNGATAGLGGATGIWDNSTANWSNVATGDVATQAFTSNGKAIFAGTAGDVTVGAGGVTAAGGVEFQVSGYTVKSNAPADQLTLGTNSGVSVTNAGDIATISAPIAGTNGLTKNGAGTLVLSGNNVFTGNLKINAGVLQASADSNLGDPTAGLVLGGGTLAVTGSLALSSTRALSGTGILDIPTGATLTVPGTVNAGVLTLSKSGTLALTGSAPSTTGLIIQADATVSSADTLSVLGAITTTQATGTAILDANVTAGSAIRAWTVANGSADVDFRVTGQISLSGVANKIQKLGPGTLEIFGDQSSMSGWQVGIAGTTFSTSATGGELRIDDFNSLGTGQFRFNDGTLNVLSAGDLTAANGGAIPAVVTPSFGAGQTGAGSDGNPLLGAAAFKGSNIEFLGAASTFVAATGTGYQHHLNVSNSVIFSGGFNVGSAVSTGLLIDGPGAVVFNNLANSIDKPITVSGATLAIAGSLTAATKPLITVTGGGLLQAHTGIAVADVGLGDLSISNGTFAPGITGIAGLVTNIPIGAVKATKLNLGPAGDFKLDLLNATIGGYDQLMITGTALGSITLAGTLTLEILPGSSFTIGDKLFPILNAVGGSPISGTFLGVADGSFIDISGYEFQVSYFGSSTLGTFIGGNDFALMVTVPEPGTASALLAGLGFIGLGRRPRRRTVG